MQASGMRTRWAAIGAAVAVTLGAGGIGLVSATSPAGAVAYVPLDEPCRAADTRPGDDNVGPKSTPLGANSTHVVNANDGDCAGLVPGSATSVLLNVTALNATTGTFLTLWASGDLPLASSLNPAPGQPPVPNAVTTGVTGAGNFNVYNAVGSVDVIIDVIGYYTDHNHDDRYYTKAQVDTAVGAKANSADVYTKTQSDSRFVNVAPLQTRVPISGLEQYSSTTPTITRFAGTTNISTNGSVVVSLDGPRTIDGRSYELDEVTYCLQSASANRFVTSATIWGSDGGTDVADTTDRQAAGCYTVEWTEGFFEGYGLILAIAGSSGSLNIASITATWSPTLTFVLPPGVIPPIITLSEGVTEEQQVAD